MDSIISSRIGKGYWKYVQLAIATIAMGYPMFRLMIPPLSMPLIATVPLLLGFWFIWQLPRPYQTIQSPFTLPIVLGILSILISSILAFGENRIVSDNVDTVAFLFHWTGSMGIVIFLLSYALAYGWHPRIFIHAILIISTMTLMYVSFIIWNWWWMWIQIWEPGQLLFPTFLNRTLLLYPSQIARLFYIGAPLAIVAMWRATRRWEQWLWGFWLLCFTIALFYTSSRGAWGAAAVGILSLVVALAWIAYRKKQPKRLLALLLITAFYVALFATLFVSNHSKIYAHHAGRFDDTIGETAELDKTITSLTNTMGRSFMWGQALHMLADHPLFGIGPNSFYAHFRDERPLDLFIPPHLHSIFFSVLVELGGIGTLIFLILAISGIWMWWRGWRTTPSESEEWFIILACSAMMISIVLHGIVDTPEVNNGGLILYVIVIVLSFANCWKLSEISSISGNKQPTCSLDKSIRLYFTQSIQALGTKSNMFRLFLVILTFGAFFVANFLFFQRSQFISKYGKITLDDYAAQQRSQALSLIRSGNNQNALQMYNHLVSLYPNEHLLLGERAFILSSMSQKEPQYFPFALAAQNEYAKYVPENSMILANQAILLMQMNREREAVNMLQQCIEKYPLQSAIPYLLLARWYESQNKHDQSRSLWQQSIEIQPDLAESVACKQSAVCSKDMVPSLSLYATILRLQPLLDQPNTMSFQDMELLSHNWGSVDLWAMSALIAERANNEHMRQRFLMAGVDESEMLEKKPTIRLGIALLRDAMKRNDGAKMKEQIHQWIKPALDLKLVPQITHLLVTETDRELAQTALAAAKQVGDAALIEQAEHYLKRVQSAFDAGEDK